VEPPVVVEMPDRSQNFKMTPEQLEATITTNTKLADLQLALQPHSAGYSWDD